jgi:hypothetical protein
MSIPVQLRAYLSVHSCDKADDDHDWSKHVVDIWTEYIVFWLDLFCIFLPIYLLQHFMFCTKVHF